MTESNQKEVRIVIYTRNTAIEQPEGHRLYRDIQVLKEKYERMGYEIQQVYSDVGCHGNAIEGRLSLKQLLTDVSLGLIDVVLVWDLFSLTPKMTNLLTIKQYLDQHDVELCSATEPFDTSTPEGRLHFQWMAALLEHEHLSCKRDISLSSFARLIMTRGERMKGGESNAESCSEFVRTA
ncbi:recombinase family protein [Bacillus ginsengihumi]|uniref:Recombinase family protein n=1 Tax=Heyndrickxia ginsengihumi TaxID=363870 RepID=A0A6M0P3L1_9BACI|nr:recombinase family protein [Heyndrickxia ginsengihumi]NEY18569.1 recombinase family protein [Heyndrickxia ginsengihumi]